MKEIKNAFAPLKKDSIRVIATNTRGDSLVFEGGAEETEETDKIFDMCFDSMKSLAIKEFVENGFKKGKE